VFLIDDILLFPERAILFLFQEIHNAAEQEFDNQAEAIRAELTELYMMLETDRVSEDEFDSQEQQLLDRLERVEARDGPAESEPGAEDWRHGQSP